MIKNFLLTLVILDALLASAVQGQSQTLTLIDSIRVPTSPAFKLFGSEPSSVERPNDLKALAIDLSKLTTDSNSLPKNFALEFGLGKLLSRTEKGILDYYYPADLGFWDNLSISLATSTIPSDLLVDSGFNSHTAWSVGLRTQLRIGSRLNFSNAIEQYESSSEYPSEIVSGVISRIFSDSTLRDTLHANLQRLGKHDLLANCNFEDLYADAVEKHATFKVPGSVGSVALTSLTFRETVHHYLLGFISDNSSALTAASTRPYTIDNSTKVNSMFASWSEINIIHSPHATIWASRMNSLATKTGDIFEVAMAIGGIARNDNINQTYVRRAGAWISYSLRPESKDAGEFSAMVRYTMNQFRNIKDSTNWDHFADLGVRLSSPRSWLATLSAEFLWRFPFSSQATQSEFRYALIGEYPLSNDLYLTATIGKNYNFQLNHQETELNNLLTLLGIKYGFGSYSVISQ